MDESSSSAASPSTIHFSLPCTHSLTRSFTLLPRLVWCVHKLSKRELQVLRLLVEGYSNPEIAAALYLSTNTVKTHVTGILNKFGVRDRIQAAVFAVRNGYA